MGLTLAVTLYLLFTALVAWQLGELVKTQPASVAVLAWGLCAVHVLSVVLSSVYISAVPAVFSGVTAALVAGGAWRARSAGHRTEAARAAA